MSAAAANAWRPEGPAWALSTTLPEFAPSSLAQRAQPKRKSGADARACDSIDSAVEVQRRGPLRARKVFEGGVAWRRVAPLAVRAEHGSMVTMSWLFALRHGPEDEA